MATVASEATLHAGSAAAMLPSEAIAQLRDLVGAVPSLELLRDTGIQAVGAHDVALANRLRDGLGMPRSDSAIVAVTTPGAAERLAAAGIRASTRAGAARLSFHLHNAPADADRALDALTATSRPPASR